MRCREARDLMMERLDARLDAEGMEALEEHMYVCGACRAEWQSVSTVDQLFRSVSITPAPPHLRAQTMMRIERRDQARRAVFGGVTLAIGATALALLTLVPLTLVLVGNLGAVPALLVGGGETLTQLMSMLDALARVLFVLLDQIATSLAVLSLITLFVAAVLNGFWIAAIRRLSVVGS